jgi:hypothetical protein
MNQLQINEIISGIIFLKSLDDAAAIYKYLAGFVMALLILIPLVEECDARKA